MPEDLPRGPPCVCEWCVWCGGGESKTTTVHENARMGDDLVPVVFSEKQPSGRDALHAKRDDV